MKSKKAVWTVIAFTIVVALSILYVLVFRADDRTTPEDAFNTRLREAVRRGEPRVKVADLTPFEWERVCYVGPYADAKRFKDVERARLAAKGAFDHAWVGSEGDWGLIFSASPWGIIAIRVPTANADTPSSYSVLVAHGVNVDDAKQAPSCFSKDEAILMIFRHEQRDYAYFTRG